EVKHIFQSDFESYIAKVEIVKNAEFINQSIAISIAEETHEDMAVIAAQSADELLSITGIMASFVLCKIDGVVMISGRSLGDINVQAILEGLGGGGHLTFAGAQIVGVTLEEAKEKLIKKIQEYVGKTEE
ncbi:MAG: DHHA1 domain-containing protein, partial [Clostridia bacterium]|nr:DHHA1 domain-containing protein [Clostridia bacterium]